jgi:SAM-dependent methyltransferase
MSTKAELTTIATRTLGHYEANAMDFWEGTRLHDVSQSRDALLEAMGSLPGRRILDFGCGPGRDLAVFQALGHHPVGLDGCATFVGMAKAHARCEVLHQSFFDLRLPVGAFDGVFANASLFHVPSAELSGVLRSLRATLVPGGVLFCSNPRAFAGASEGFRGARYGNYQTVEAWESCLTNAGFGVERAFLRPADIPEEERPWIAHVARRGADAALDPGGS